MAWGVREFPAHLAEDSRFHRFSDFLELGKNVSDKAIDAAEAENRAGTCCTLVYTGGATGQPKGVMLSHDNLVANMVSVSASFIGSFPHGINVQPENIRMVSFLPLDQVSTLGFDIICNILWGSQLYFAKPGATVSGSLLETLLWCRPTILFGGPRVWGTLETVLDGQLKKLTGV